jgi:hypothetical protein
LVARLTLLQADLEGSALKAVTCPAVMTSAAPSALSKP